eukprot:560365-Prymnesium_polylepis.1
MSARKRPVQGRSGPAAPAWYERSDSSDDELAQQASAQPCWASGQSPRMRARQELGPQSSRPSGKAQSTPL